MKKKVSFLIVIIALLLIVALLAAPRKAGASDGIPKGVQRFYDCNNVCYVWPDGSGDCYPCLPNCEESETQPTLTVTNEPQPTPKPTKKPKCNRGKGNGPEDCDPGNSGGNPGKAGEKNE